MYLKSIQIGAKGDEVEMNIKSFLFCREEATVNLREMALKNVGVT